MWLGGRPRPQPAPWPAIQICLSLNKPGEGARRTRSTNSMRKWESMWHLAAETLSVLARYEDVVAKLVRIMCVPLLLNLFYTGWVFRQRLR